MAKGTPKFTLKNVDEETLVVVYNGNEIARATHDSEGWAGIDLLRKTIREVGRALDIPVKER